MDKSPLKSGENGRIGGSTFCKNFRFCRKPGARRNYPTTQCTVASSQVPHHASFLQVTCQKSVGNQKVSLGKMQILKSYNQFRGCGHNDNAMMYLNHGRCHDLLFMFFCTFIFWFLHKEALVEEDFIVSIYCVCFVVLHSRFVFFCKLVEGTTLRK